MEEPRCPNCNDLIELHYKPTACYKCGHPLPFGPKPAQAPPPVEWLPFSHYLLGGLGFIGGIIAAFVCLGGIAAYFNFSSNAMVAAIFTFALGSGGIAYRLVLNKLSK